MSLFGEGTTITPPGSPDAGQGQQGGAGSLEDQYDDADLQDGELEGDLDGQDDDQDDADGDDDQQDDDDQGDQDGDDEPADGADNSDKDGLILGKFKTQDDLANAYINLQREFSKRNSQPTGQQQPPARQQTTVPGQTGMPEQSEQFWEMFQQNPLGTMQYLIDNAVAARTAPIEEQRQMDMLGANMQQIAKQYKQVATPEGMQQLFGKVAEIVQEIGNPQLAKNPTARILRMAASEAFGDSGQAIYNKAKEEGRRQAEESRRAKKGLPTASGGKKGGPAGKGGEQKSEADLIREGIVAAGRSSGGILGL